MKCSTPEISYHSRAGGVNQPILSVDVLGTRMLASGGADDEVKLWDILGEPKFLAGLTGHLKTVNVVRFSPDGRFLASASDGTCSRLLARSLGAFGLVVASNASRRRQFEAPWLLFWIGGHAL
jgi:WD40 repeat protein